MFDPTIFDNLKVVLEGAVYDLDLEGTILVTSRQDYVDLSSMSRTYEIGFAMKGEKPVAFAELSLHASLKDLSAEILEVDAEQSGCTLGIKFLTQTRDPNVLCNLIQQEMAVQWSGRPIMEQTVSYTHGAVEQVYTITVSLSFGRKVNESHVQDFPELIEYAAASLEWLTQQQLKQQG
ncbi:hypothetical protein NV379_01670 [Paenibacillus sp. N1-5-1-14]|uniref:hypothetical protein n=1 Tax=Paenibacillus radicibacter TaxID=2972488 RepID=UPI002158EDBA|nr:hypothetical protein [Paenibacillus radicibacter]MCR8641353.1 hypothetical protein [Paenibacillus radicibacter]